MILALLVSSSDFKDMLEGFVLSLKLTAALLVIGLPLGLVLALFNDSRWGLLRWASVVTVEIGRGAPLLLLLYLVYYGLPEQGIVLSAFVAATVALAFSAAAYSSETFRAAIHAVAPQQRDAGMALGMSRAQTFGSVVMPQAFRIALPQIISLSIGYLQATAIAFAVTLPELLKRAYDSGSRTFLYLNALLAAAFIYAVFCLPVAWFGTWLERRMSGRLTR